MQHEDESGDEGFDEELEQVIQQEHSKFLQQQADYYEQLQANRSWKVVPLASPGPAVQLQREEEKQEYAQVRQASGSIGAYQFHALYNNSTQHALSPRDAMQCGAVTLYTGRQQLVADDSDLTFHVCTMHHALHACECFRPHASSYPARVYLVAFTHLTLVARALFQ